MKKLLPTNSGNGLFIPKQENRNDGYAKRNAPNPDIPLWTMAFAPLRELIASFVLAIMIIRLNLTDWAEAVKLMLLLWLAFHAIGMAGAILWDNMHWQLGAIHAGDSLMKTLFMGVGLTIWFNKKLEK